MLVRHFPSLNAPGDGSVASPQELSAADVAHVAGGVGSQSTGAGAGKITFNPFSITRKID